MRFRVTYARAADLVADAEQQFAHGGLLVAVSPPSGIDRGAAVALELVSPHGRARVPATVIAPLPGAGIAVAFDTDDAALQSLVAAARRARAAQGEQGAPPHHELLSDFGADNAIELGAPIELDLEPGVAVDPDGGLDLEGVAIGPPDTLEVDLGPDLDLGDDTSEEAHAPESVADLGSGRTVGRAAETDANMAQKIQRALHGDRNERLAILRDTNRALHSYALRNPNIQLDEIIWVAKQATVSAELLSYIAGRREWIQRPEIAAALVRNPKTPPPLAIKLLDLVAPAELRLLAKQTSVRDVIQRAARKKLLGGT